MFAVSAPISLRFRGNTSFWMFLENMFRRRFLICDISAHSISVSERRFRSVDLLCRSNLNRFVYVSDSRREQCSSLLATGVFSKDGNLNQLYGDC